MENLNIKTLLIINNNLASIKTRFKEHNPYSNGLYKYLKTIDPVLASKSYLLIAEFNDKSYAYLRVDDVNVVVTFDANGGSVKTRTKNVTPGKTLLLEIRMENYQHQQEKDIHLKDGMGRIFFLIVILFLLLNGLQIKMFQLQKKMVLYKFFTIKTIVHQDIYIDLIMVI